MKVTHSGKRIMVTYGLIVLKSIREIKAFIQLYFRNLIITVPIAFLNEPN